MSTEPIDIVITKTGDAEASAGILGVAGSLDKLQGSLDATTSTSAGAKSAIEGVGQAGSTAVGGAESHSKALDHEKASAEAATTAMEGLREALGLLGLAFGIEKVIEYADSYTRVQNTLKDVTHNAAEFEHAEKALFDVSMATRTEMEQNAKTYSMFARTTDGLGFTYNDLARAVKTFDESVKLSNRGPEESARAMRTLQFAMQGGEVGAQALTMVLKQFPAVGQAVAIGLYGTASAVTRVEEEAARGELSTKRFTQALIDSGVAMDTRFASRVVTVKEALGNVGTALEQFIGGTGQATGASTAMATGLQLLATHIDIVAGVLLSAGGAFLVWKTGTLIMAGVTAVVQGLSAAMFLLDGALLPLVATIGAVVAAAAVLALGFEMIRNKSLDVGAAAQRLKTDFGLVAETVKSALPELTGFGGGLTGVATVAATTKKELAAMNGEMGGSSKNLHDLGMSADSAAAHMKLMQDQAKSLNETDKQLGIGGSYTVDQFGQLRASMDGVTGSMGAHQQAAKSTEGSYVSLNQATVQEAVSLGFLSGAQEGSDKASKAGVESMMKFKESLVAAKQAQDAMANQELEKQIQADAQAATQYAAALEQVAKSAEQASRAEDDAFSKAKGGLNGLGGGGASGATNQILLGGAGTPGVNGAGTGTGGGVGAEYRGINDPAFRGQGDRIARFLDSEKGRQFQNHWYGMGRSPGVGDLLDAAAAAGFKSGGSYTVPGSGGPDSQMIMMAASPGETIHVATPQQETQIAAAASSVLGAPNYSALPAREQAVITGTLSAPPQSGGGRGAAPGGGTVNHIGLQMTVNTPDAASFGRSRNQVLTQMQSALNSIAARLQ